jgi:hypothetical protein
MILAFIAPLVIGVLMTVGAKPEERLLSYAVVVSFVLALYALGLGLAALGVIR